MIGQTISHYRITKKLGEGGMGEVYLAEDTSLKRKVALKFLPEHLHQDELAHKRFLREAESAAALDHPYICHINEVSQTESGQDFIVMEYVEGQTLKDKLEEGPLAIEEVLQISTQVADALTLAHQRGIVHRDLKPANIMLTAQGHAKVMDFGLAKKVITDEETQQDLTSGLTREGSTLGTPAYMSPEQVRAQPVDHRSDIFSFGIILYEMLTGEHPFRRIRPVETMGAILHEEPEPIANHVPTSTELLQQTVTELLGKDPEQRIQTIDEVAIRLNQLSSRAEELHLVSFLRSRLAKRLALALTAVIAIALISWWALKVGTGEAGGPIVSSIAVLPLTNLSRDPEQDYFVDAMTDALITDLSRSGELRVTGRRSAMLYKDSDKPLSEIARELDVEAIVEGSVLREGDQVRVTAQLIEAETERNLWADRYERKMTSILALQGELAQAIAQEIQVTLTPADTDLLTPAKQINPEAYENYLKGQFHWYKLTKPDLETALQYYQLALEKDRNYAAAYAGIAMAWAGLQQFGFARPGDAGPKAREAALKAVELDDTSAEAHYALAMVRTWTDWDWEGAEESYLRAIELDPKYGDVRAYYAHFLTMMRRSEEAIAQMEQALALDPLSPLFRGLYGVVLLYAHRDDDAIAEFRNVLKTVPNHPLAYTGLREALYAKRAYDELLTETKAYYTAIGDEQANESLTLGEAEAGHRGALIRLAETLAERSRSEPVLLLEVAQAYAHAGKNDRVLEWLERGFEERDPNMPYLAVSRDWDDLRGNPRFQNLLRRMNLQ